MMKSRRNMYSDSCLWLMRLGSWLQQWVLWLPLSSLAGGVPYESIVIERLIVNCSQFIRSFSNGWFLLCWISNSTDGLWVLFAFFLNNHLVLNVYFFFIDCIFRIWEWNYICFLFVLLMRKRTVWGWFSIGKGCKLRMKMIFRIDLVCIDWFFKKKRWKRWWV